MASLSCHAPGVARDRRVPRTKDTKWWVLPASPSESSRGARAAGVSLMTITRSVNPASTERVGKGGVGGSRSSSYRMPWRPPSRRHAVTPGVTALEIMLTWPRPAACACTTLTCACERITPLPSFASPLRWVLAERLCISPFEARVFELYKYSFPREHQYRANARSAPWISNGLYS